MHTSRYIHAYDATYAQYMYGYIRIVYELHGLLAQDTSAEIQNTCAPFPQTEFHTLKVLWRFICFAFMDRLQVALESNNGIWGWQGCCRNGMVMKMSRSTNPAGWAGPYKQWKTASRKLLAVLAIWTIVTRIKQDPSIIQRNQAFEVPKVMCLESLSMVWGVFGKAGAAFML